METEETGEEENTVTGTRKKFLEDLDKSINSSSERLENILCRFGWTRKVLFDSGKPSVQECQEDPNHFVPKSKEHLHQQYCCLRKQGLSREESREIMTQKIFDDHAGVVFDADTLSKILAKFTTNTRGEAAPKDLEFQPQSVRLAVYDEVVAESKRIKQSDPVDDELFFLDRKGWEKMKEEGDKQRKSKIEELAEQRDMKRRRQTYRAKNVHTTRKSHTEIIREVIANQMEVLEKMILDEEDAKMVTASTSTNRQTDNSSDRKRSKKHKHKHGKHKEAKKEEN